MNELDLFTEALNRTDPAERVAFLDEACSGNPHLRRRLEELLAGHARTDSPLDRPPGSPEGVTITDDPPTEDMTGAHSLAISTLAQADADAATEGLGTVPPLRMSATSEGLGAVVGGKYTLVDLIGEGGMGAVYLASQTEPVTREVALKLIRTGMDSRQVLARFDAERQALALMDHPNIARIYDGGLTPLGRPFFVMELVKGEPLTDYCDKRRLSIKARLELFVTICQAVQHAHLKGIIHRDLKPGNILVVEVDGRPTPKVIDFGVAKATELKLTDMSLADVGAIVGTPAYMSPEQADPSSLDIDTRSDVYSLGVILYELLAGSPPLESKQFRRGALLEMLRMVREVEPPRPSTKLSTAQTLPDIAANRSIDPAQLRRAVRGDLDWVVMKALEKDRARRYETANSFAADILRHLMDEPVQAAPPSRIYRTRKFVRKHRGPVIAASLLLVSLLAGIAGTAWGLFRADQAVQVAEARAEELKYRLGVDDMALASAAYDRNNLIDAVDHLSKVPEEQRGWEWRYLKGHVRGGLFTLYGHTSGVTSVAFSPDGTRIVTGSYDNTARVWDARTGVPLVELKGHSGIVTSVSFSPDGTRIVTGSGDNTAKVWDARTGVSLVDLKGHAHQVNRVSFSPDGMWIVTGSDDKKAKVWNARNGMCLVELKGHFGVVSSVSFSPDGTRIVTGSHDNTAKVWDARTGTSLVDLKGHSIWVSSVSFSPDGTRIVTGSHDNTAKVWDARTGKSLVELKGHSSVVSSVSFSPDGTRIVTGSHDNTAKVWDARTGESLVELKGHLFWVTSVSFSPDGTRIITGSHDNTAKVWDARMGMSLVELTGHASPVTSVSISPDGTRIVTGSHDNTAKVWDARTGKSLVELKGHSSVVSSVSFSPDGTRIVTGSHDNTAKVWDARTGKSLVELKGHSSWVSSVSFSPDGTRIVTGSYDYTAKVWGARTGKFLVELKGHASPVTSVSFSPDGTRIVTGSHDKTAKVWDARTGEFLVELKGHSSWVTSVSFSPDGTRIVTGSEDKTAKVWDARTGKSLVELKGHSSLVASVSFSPDGTRIVTGSEDKTAKVWDARTGKSLVELKGHSNLVTSASFSSDGTRIVTGSEDTTAKVWDARTGVSLVELKGHSHFVSSVSFSSDGTRIVTGSYDNTAKVWDARTGMPLFDLKGHSSVVSSVSFSSDGTRIVTGSWDNTAKVWDARTGMPLFDLKGQTKEVLSVSFSLDGARIVTRSYDNSAKVWDARTGEEQKGSPIPPLATWSPISPDGRLFAHVVGNRVELVPLQPDAEELQYRRIVTQSNPRRYRDGYDSAKEAGDDFAVKFYLNLLPVSEQKRLFAEEIVTPLFARVGLRDEVLATLEAQPAADPDIQSACLELAATWPENALNLNKLAWNLVRDLGQPITNYRNGLRLAEAACRIEPDNSYHLNTQGIAQYRCGLMTEALATLTRSNDMNNQQEPADLAFLALAQHRLGQSEKASATLLRLREVMKGKADDPEATAFLREAEMIEFDLAFPKKPFAP